MLPSVVVPDPTVKEPIPSAALNVPPSIVYPEEDVRVADPPELVSAPPPNMKVPTVRLYPPRSIAALLELLAIVTAADGIKRFAPPKRRVPFVTNTLEDNVATFSAVVCP